LLPIKAGKLKKRNRWFYYFIVQHNGKIYVRKRGPKEIWENLYEFLLLETDNLLPVDEIQKTAFFKNITSKSKFTVLDVSKMYKQQLTHQTIHGCFIQLSLKNKPPLKDYKPITYKEIGELPFPKFITGFLAENELKAFAG
jgi:A/G-specific adenine glycosylase